MDLVVEKLEDFGLEKFIHSYRFYLCSATVSPLKVAVALMFDADQSAIITHPPDNFSKCEKLYELVQKKSEAKSFLEALNETGNEHILKFIKETDFSTANSNTNRSRGIWFNIPEPIDSFCGREDFLSQLHDQLKSRDDAETEVTVLSQVKIVSGLGGIGKTQTMRRYISQYFEFYNNFIWVDAETENSMRNSFLKLAEEIKINAKNSEGKPREIEVIVKEIYNKICDAGKSNLIVFDNAEDYSSCKNFFPFGLHPELKKPVILATSRNQEWKSTHGKIHVLPLDKMTDDESREFILKELEIAESEIPGFKEESKEFIELIGGLPLALQQAVAYIKHEKKVNELLSRPYEMRDYVKEFKSSARKLQNFAHAPDSSTTIFITWNLTLNKIKQDSKGGIAIQAIELMSFLYADKIPIEFLLQLLPPPQNWVNRLQNVFGQQHEDFQSTERDLVDGMNLLEKFSMIKITGNFVSVHRQVQFVLMQNLKNSNELPKMFNQLLKKCRGILREVKMAESGDIFLNVHQIVNNHLNLIPMTPKFREFMAEFGSVLFHASRYSESLALFKKVYKKCQELFGEYDKETVSAQHQIAANLLQLGRYDEALTLNKEILRRTAYNFGVDHPNTIATKHNMACVLRQQKKYQEALELLEQVLAQKNKIHGENHPKTLPTLNSIASVHSDLGDFSQASALFQQLEVKQVGILGPDHPDVLVTKHDKATVLFKMGKFEEAAKIFNQVYEKQKEVLGENHLSTINTLQWIGGTLEQGGKWKEALDIYKKVYKIRRRNLGEDNPHTILVKSQIEQIECNLKLLSTGEYVLYFVCAVIGIILFRRILVK